MLRGKMIVMTSRIQRIDDDRITAFGLLIEAERRLQRTFERSLRLNHGMSLVTFEALVRLGRSEDMQMSMSELAEQMVLTSGGVTRLIDRLEGIGAVERIQCPSDRRVQWARLTEAGGRMLETALETHLADLEEHFASEIEPAEYDTFVRVLDRLRSECPG
jgi:DNA-binding MarR family transcriptional regulator